VLDPAVTVTLPLVDDEDDAAFLAWTTTPWTLPSNLALCVHPEVSLLCVFMGICFCAFR
jgi:isoleucyl-tRNA synthetase